MKGVITIEARNAVTGELENSFEQTNTITDEFMWYTGRVQSFRALISITDAVFESSVVAPRVPYYPVGNDITSFRSVIGSTTIPGNALYGTYNPKTSTNEAFIQYVARYSPPPVGSSRTIATVMLTAPYDEGYWQYRGRAWAFAKLATPCVQTDTQVFDIYYRVFFEYDELNSDVHRRWYDGYTAYFVAGAVNANSMFDNHYVYPWPTLSGPDGDSAASMEYHYGDTTRWFQLRPSSTTLGFSLTRTMGFDDHVGEVINGVISIPTSDMSQQTYAVSNSVELSTRFNKIQNLIGHREELTSNYAHPFLDVDNLPTSSGRITLGGDWEDVDTPTTPGMYFQTKFPEWNKIQITAPGAVGVSEYNYTTQVYMTLATHDSPNGQRRNTHQPVAVPGLCAAPSTHISFGTSVLGDTSVTKLDSEQISSTIGYDESSVLIPSKDKLVLFSIPGARYWRITGGFTNIGQLAVSNGVVYIGCRATGLWSVDPRSTTTATPVVVSGADVSACYGVAAGNAGSVLAIVESGLIKYDGSNWTAIANPYTVATNLFAFLKIDTLSASNQSLAVYAPSAETRLGEWWSESTSAQLAPTQPALSGYGRPRINRAHVLGLDGQWVVSSNGTAYYTSFGGASFAALNTGGAQDRGIGAPFAAIDSSGTAHIGTINWAGANRLEINSDTFYSDVRVPYVRVHRNGALVQQFPNADSIGTISSDQTVNANTPVTKSIAGYGGGEEAYGFVQLQPGVIFTIVRTSASAVRSHVWMIGLENNPHGGALRWIAQTTYGWDGANWVKNHPASKPTHTAAEPLLDGVTVRFEDGTSGTSFQTPNYFKFGLARGLMKDNATRASFTIPFHTAKTEAGLVPTLSSTTVPAPIVGETGLVGVHQHLKSAGAALNGSNNVVFPGNNRGQFAVGDKQLIGDFRLQIPMTGFDDPMSRYTTIVGIGHFSRFATDERAAIEIRRHTRTGTDTQIAIIVGGSDQTYVSSGSATDVFEIQRTAGTITILRGSTVVHTVSPTQSGISADDQALDVIYSVTSQANGNALWGAVPANLFTPAVTILANGTTSAVWVGDPVARTGAYNLRFKGIDTTIRPIVTIDGVPASVKLREGLPAPGEAAVDWRQGCVYFNSADVGKPITVDCIRVYTT